MRSKARSVQVAQCGPPYQGPIVMLSRITRLWHYPTFATAKPCTVCDNGPRPGPGRGVWPPSFLACTVCDRHFWASWPLSPDINVPSIRIWSRIYCTKLPYERQDISILGVQQGTSPRCAVHAPKAAELDFQIGGKRTRRLESGGGGILGKGFSSTTFGRISA